MDNFNKYAIYCWSDAPDEYYLTEEFYLNPLCFGSLKLSNFENYVDLIEDAIKNDSYYEGEYGGILGYTNQKGQVWQNM